MLGGAVFFSSMALLGVALAPTAASAAVTATSHFVVTATSANDTGAVVQIDNGATNDSPNALLFVTQSYDPGGVCDPACAEDSSPFGVSYDEDVSAWYIFSEDQQGIPIGDSFNVLVVPQTSSEAFVQTAAASGNSWTYINSPATDANPKASLQVSQLWEGVYNPNTVGVFYSSSAGRWAVFNEDGATMPANASFNVMVGATKSGGGVVALQTANAKNADGGTQINSKTTNGDPNAVVFVTPNYNPKGKGGTYDLSEPGVYYNSASSETTVFNEDGQPVPAKTAFNVVLYNS